MAAHRKPSGTTAGDVRVGISGWTYPPWRGVFFPSRLPQKRELEYAAGIFRTIEINGTFYSLQRPKNYLSWAERTPDDFVFSVKGSRYITHLRRLRDVEIPLANFFASGLLCLGPKLGPILWQFPPNFRYSPDLVEEFFSLLPRDTYAAAELGEKHEPRMKGRVFLDPECKRKLRHAMEIRHPSFLTPAFIRQLRRHRVALVCADAVEWPRPRDVTADFVYCRLHGSKELYASGYGPKAIDAWTRRVAHWARGGELREGEYASSAKATVRKKDVFVYFDNDAKVRAPRDAQRMVQRLPAYLSEE